MENKSQKSKGSRAKLRDYFVYNVGKILESDQLREVAGTSAPSNLKAICSVCNVTEKDEDYFLDCRSAKQC
jgi:hypothetical protein